MNKVRIFHLLVLAAFAFIFLKSGQPVLAETLVPVSPPISVIPPVATTTTVNGYWGPDIPVVLNVHVDHYASCFCFIGGQVQLSYTSTTGPKTKTAPIGPSGDVTFHVAKSGLFIGTLFTAQYSGNYYFSPSSGTIYVYFDPSVN